MSDLVRAAAGAGRVVPGVHRCVGHHRGSLMISPNVLVRAVVVGGGFIGLETAENLIHIGFDVTLIQNTAHVLGPLDPEIACLVQEHIKKNGVSKVVIMTVLLRVKIGV